ncbi:glycerol-3-phosphate 1-O-acyltransferase PlsY [Vulgatibacter sp.]|uniref:glycerol-3-phosphate 1-O-acyltransferase PlsY n=1 Tax=Vulgatibacter sp. TaxID=1971226 RepID=UPI003566042F
MNLAFLVGAYLLGAVPFGLLVARRFARIDVRLVGSGNIGATNVARAAGKRVAALVLLLDAAKGFVPALLAAKLLADPWWMAAVGFAAFIGHCFPIYLRFRGGKGVATALGVNLALVPLAALAGVVVYVGLYKAFRVSSLGSLAGALTAALVAFLVAPSPAFAWGILAMVLVIFVRHSGNIRRLLRREERRV